LPRKANIRVIDLYARIIDKKATAIDFSTIGFAFIMKQYGKAIKFQRRREAG
jgi:hypothetical protein